MIPRRSRRVTRIAHSWPPSPSRSIANRSCVREGQPPISAHATELLLREAWATLEAVREAAGRQPSLGAALCDFYEAAMRAGASGARRGEGGTALLEWLPRIVAALHALLATHLASGTDAEAPPAEADPADMACQLLGALATAVECFGGAAEASGFLGTTRAPYRRGRSQSMSPR